VQPVAGGATSSCATKPSPFPPPGPNQKSLDDVLPPTSAKSLPDAAAIAAPLSPPLPPRKAEYSRLPPLGLRMVTKASLVPPSVVSW
jgi:hypothetical protein